MLNGLHTELWELGMEESQDLINGMREGLTALQGDTGDEEADFDVRVGELFRYAHTLKGVSRTIGLAEIEEIAGGLERFFKEVRASRSVGTLDGTLFSEEVDNLLARLDEAIRDIERNQL